MNLEQALNAFVNHMLHGVTLNVVELTLGTFRLTNEICSGFMVERDGRYLILSAGHGLRRGHWFVETPLVIEEEARVLTLPLQPVNYISQIQLGDGGLSAHDVDLAWVELNLERLRAEIGKDPKLKGRPLSLPVYKGPLDERPSPSEAYGFAAWNRAIYDRQVSKLRREASYEVGMEYVGDAEHGGVLVHRFKLARPYQGHAYYKGASGAPIADPTGKIVSIVLVGDREQEEILGLPLAQYSSVLTLSA